MLHQVVDGDSASHHHVVLELSSEFADVLYLVPHHGVLGQTERRYAVHQHSAELVQSFENSDVVAHSQQVLGAGDARRAAAHDGHLMAVFACRGCELHVVLASVVADKTFQLANGDGFETSSHYAFAFALCLLRAYTSAHRRQGGVLVDNLCGFVEIAFSNAFDEIGDFDVDRAALHASGFLALQTALRLHYGLVGTVAETYLVEVLGTYQRRLFRHRHTFRLVASLFDDTADMTHVAFFNLLFFNLFAGGDIVVHRLTFHGVVEIHKGTIELGAVHAGEHRFSAHNHAAGTAHSSAVNHNGVETNGAFDAVLLCHIGHSAHHHHRADGHNFVVMCAVLYLLLQNVGYQTFVLRSAVVGGDKEVAHGA